MLTFRKTHYNWGLQDSNSPCYMGQDEGNWYWKWRKWRVGAGEQHSTTQAESDIGNNQEITGNLQVLKWYQLIYSNSGEYWAPKTANQGELNLDRMSYEVGERAEVFTMKKDKMKDSRKNNIGKKTRGSENRTQDWDREMRSSMTRTDTCNLWGSGQSAMTPFQWSEWYGKISPFPATG